MTSTSISSEGAQAPDATPRGVSVRGLSEAAATFARGLAFAIILLSLVLSRSEASFLTILLMLGVGVGTLLALDRTRAGVAPFALYMAGFVLFAILRTAADDTGISVKGQYVVDAERSLFGGGLPTQWLQDLLYHPGEVRLIAIVCAVVYTSYYLAVHVVALTFWRRSRCEFKRLAIAVMLTAYAGLTVSFVLPTAPPWLAHEYSDGPVMTRVVAEVLGWNPEKAGSETPGVNPYAAMPSLHFALTVLIVLALWSRPRLRVGAVLYAVIMGFALVYGAEHYVVDLIAGALVAFSAWQIASRAGSSQTVQGAPARPSRKATSMSPRPDVVSP